jgi:hypothetical protein
MGRSNYTPRSAEENARRSLEAAQKTRCSRRCRRSKRNGSRRERCNVAPCAWQRKGVSRTIDPEDASGAVKERRPTKVSDRVAARPSLKLG